MRIFFLLLILFTASVIRAQSWQTLDSLATLAIAGKDFKRAELLLNRLADTVVLIKPQNDSITARAYRRLVTFYNRNADYEKALEWGLKTKTAQAKHSKLIDYWEDCSNLASFYRINSSYLKAEEELSKLLKDLVEAKQDNTLIYARAKNSLADVYQEQGLYDLAEPIYEDCMKILEDNKAKTSSLYANICNSFSALKKRKGDYVYAAKLQATALEIAEKIHGKKSSIFAHYANNQGLIYFELREYDKTEEYYKMAYEIRKEINGTNHPEYAQSCNNLGSLYRRQDKKALAEQLLLECVAIMEKVFGPRHANYVYPITNLAGLYNTTGDLAKALNYHLAILKNRNYQIQITLPLLAAKEKIAFLNQYHSYYNFFYAFAIEFAKIEPSIMATAYNQVLFSKGVVFNSAQKLRMAAENSQDSVLKNTYTAWKNARQKLSRLAQTPIGSNPNLDKEHQMQEIEVNKIETDLYRICHLMTEKTRIEEYDWENLAAALNKNEAIVDILRTSYFQALNPDRRDTVYIAFISTPESTTHPHYVILPHSADLEQKYLTYYKNCIYFEIEDRISYEVFWRPIANKLKELGLKKGAKIYFSPDGAYHQINLNTLFDSTQNIFLLNEANIQLIGSSSDLIYLKKNSGDLSQNKKSYHACMLGYPLYGGSRKNDRLGRISGTGYSNVQEAVGVAGSVSLLPATQREVQKIFEMFNKKQLKASLLMAENATEEAIKRLKNPTILHLATHGFFIPEIKDNAVRDIQSAMNRNLLKNPFMRSGLLLAGCQKPNPEGEDGILTAEEVLNLSLDSTELVVMSACETGLGDIQTGEGVFGLQRAFLQAGAKSVLMSLWKVDDEATQTLMTEFYSALLSGYEKRKAFKMAQMTLRKRFPAPYYWGAFVLVGE